MRRNSRESDHKLIPVFFNGHYGGHGDLSSTVQLTRSLRANLPDRPISLFSHHSFDERSQNALISIEPINLSDRQIMSASSRVSIVSVVPANARETQDSGLLTGSINNLYIEEYDSSSNIALPPEFGSRSRVCVGEEGKFHMAVPTGFQEGSLGIHVHESLVGRETVVTPNIKQKLLARLGWGEDLADRIPGITGRKWGATYYPPQTWSDVDSSESYYHYLREAYLQGGLDEPVVIFDFSYQVTPDRIACYNSRHVFTHHFRSEDGRIETVAEKSKWRERYPVHVVHVGARPHDHFVAHLQYSELPVGVTGDMSLSEAVSLGKPFIYFTTPWKNSVIPNLVDAIPRLADLETASKLRAMYGAHEPTKVDIDSYPDVEVFYRANRAKIVAIEREYLSRWGQRDCPNFVKLLIQGLNADGELSKFIIDNEFAIAMAASEGTKHEDLSDKELEELWIRHVFGTGVRMQNDNKLHKLFYDTPTIDVFKRFTTTLTDKLNLGKNIASLVRAFTRS